MILAIPTCLLFVGVMSGSLPVAFAQSGQGDPATLQPLDDEPMPPAGHAPQADAPVGHADETVAPASQPMALQSIIHDLPDYSGNWLEREYLTGDWGGVRTDLANHGILFDFDVTQVMQGNAHGGKHTHNGFRYSGSADYKIRLDTARMGLWPGGLITLRGETQFGQSINPKVGSFAPANFDGLLPLPNESGYTTLSEFYIAQALSEKFVILAGKLDLTTLGDDNAFAHSERTQFLNAAFRINPILFPAAPYTTMGAGIILIPTKWLTISTLIADNDPEGAVKKTGFNTAFHDRQWYSVMQEYTFKVKPFGKPGHQRFGAFWTSRDFVDFSGDPRLNVPSFTSLGPRHRGPFKLPRPSRRFRSINIAGNVFSTDGPDRRPDDWGVYYNFDQFLYTEQDDPEQGFGLFGRFGWSTGEANPIEQFYSIGVGGKGSIPGRDKDTWGLGYYMINATDDLPVALGVDAEQGTELYYNIEVTPWFHLSPSLQVIVDPGAGFRDRDVAVVYGMRAQMKF